VAWCWLAWKTLCSGELSRGVGGLDDPLLWKIVAWLVGGSFGNISEDDLACLMSHRPRVGGWEFWEYLGRMMLFDLALVGGSFGKIAENEVVRCCVDLALLIAVYRSTVAYTPKQHLLFDLTKLSRPNKSC